MDTDCQHWSIVFRYILIIDRKVSHGMLIQHYGINGYLTSLKSIHFLYVGNTIVLLCITGDACLSIQKR